MLKTTKHVTIPIEEYNRLIRIEVLLHNILSQDTAYHQDNAVNYARKALAPEKPAAPRIEGGGHK